MTLSVHLEQVFGTGGILAQKFPGYAPRAGQVAMAGAVDAAFEGQQRLVAEGPCGTGKSLAYLVPATHHAAKNGRRVLVVTANIALQEQLVSKDLPLLAEVLPWKFTYSLLKGRNNYLCLDKREATEVKAAIESRDEEVERLRTWARDTTTGDVSELPVIPAPRAWARFSVSADECKGKPCKFYKDCFAEQARRRAKEAQVIVANYHILFTHLAVKIATGKDLVLPHFDALVCDESHELVDIAREFFGWKVTAGTIAHVTKKLGEAQLRKDIEAESTRFFEGLAELRRAKSYKARLRKPATMPDYEALTGLLFKAAQVYESHRQVAEATGDKDAAAEWRIAERGVANAAARINVAMAAESYGSEIEAVFFVELDEKGRASLNSKKIDVSAAIAEHLWSDLRTAVLTSATLTVGGSFEHIARETGLDRSEKGYARCAAESPFDWQRQALLVIPVKEVPEPREATFDGAAIGLVEKTIGLARGRTLAIFTSRKNLDAAHRHVAGRVPFRVLKQGERPRTQLVEEFRRDVSSVLLGTKSFWTGVDVSGEALSCVVIDKLPFPTPDDPVADAISERDPDAFFNYFVPRAVTAFKQGFGRLIRSTADRGVVVVLDKRLVTKGYGRTFLRSLPPAGLSTRLEDVGEFLGGESR
jgi:ATP-dependent DNA helicase DinG